MNDILFNLGVSAVLTALKLALKDEHHKQQLRSVMLKIYTQIGLVYADDESFDADVSAKVEKANSIQ